MRCTAVITALILYIAAAAPAYAEPTAITVTVLSKGAKFIGSSMGGVEIIMKDKHTGRVLARGVTSGGTGDTTRIMKNPRTPGAPLSDESAARFSATIDIDEPVCLEVTARGPLAHLQAQNTVSSTQWVMPGEHINSGDGWMLEMPGFAVDIIEPSSGAKLDQDTGTVSIRAHITMMCGCPLIPGGLWNSEVYTISARVKKNGKLISEVQLSYAGSPSRFAAPVPLSGPGAYEVCVYAYDPSNGNTGLDRVSFIVD